ELRQVLLVADEANVVRLGCAGAGDVADVVLGVAFEFGFADLGEITELHAASRSLALAVSVLVQKAHSYAGRHGWVGLACHEDGKCVAARGEFLGGAVFAGIAVNVAGVKACASPAYFRVVVYGRRALDDYVDAEGRLGAKPDLDFISGVARKLNAQW